VKWATGLGHPHQYVITWERPALLRPRASQVRLKKSLPIAFVRVVSQFAWSDDECNFGVVVGHNRGAIVSQLRSDALENLRTSHPCHAAIRGDVCRDPSCGNGRRADKASGPNCGRSAIWRPVPRRLEHDPRAPHAPCQIIGNSWTGARRTADKDSGEISRRVDRQNLQQRAPLTLPNGGEQALGRRRSSGCEKKKQSGDDTGHILLQLVVADRAAAQTLLSGE